MGPRVRKHEPIDVAVAFGLVRPELPPILDVAELVAQRPQAPPHIIGGVLHQGSKMVMAGTSKSNKTWCLVDLALSVACGQPWWQRPTARSDVLYLNFELADWAMLERLDAVARARPELKGFGHSLHVWNLRGHSTDFSELRPQLQRRLDRHDFGLIILDPAYKLLGDRDENANGDITSLMNEFERLCVDTGAAVVLAHHFAKGDSTGKEAADRMSGAGAWARDPDSIMVLTPHEEPGCYTVQSILRNMPQVPEFVVAWEYPIMRVARDLDPAALRSRQTGRKMCSDHEFASRFLEEQPKSRGRVVSEAMSTGMAARTVDRYLKRLAAAGLVGFGNGCYWLLKQEE